ncbi:MAG: efflux RND transporter permease subunit, partial [Akkermansiaceae bacterium]|nr:efflux RND transporter permease subunit [Akkermansiaceae bacterium]
LRIEVDRKRAMAYGVTPGELNRELASLMGGETVAEIHEDQRVYDLVVRLPSGWRENPRRLGNLSIDTQRGQRIPLSYVAEIRQAAGPNAIKREDSQRRFVIAINPTTPDTNTAVERLEEEIEAGLDLPRGYEIRIEGEYQDQKVANRTLLVSSVLVFLIIVFLLYGYFQSFKLVSLVIIIIPVSLIGAVFYTREALNIVSSPPTYVGAIAIAGIAARNNIMMISHYLHLMRHEGEGFTREMVARGTQERLVPVLMTALSAGIALVPLILAAYEPGKEILYPVAIAIVGGLISSTVLGLGLTPALFHTFCRKSAEKAVAR